MTEQTRPTDTEPRLREGIFHVWYRRSPAMPERVESIEAEAAQGAAPLDPLLPDSAVAEMLRKVIRQYHGNGHREGSWTHCDNRWCRDAQALLEGAAPRAEGRSLTEEERAEIRDWYDSLPEGSTPIYRAAPRQIPIGTTSNADEPNNLGQQLQGAYSAGAAPRAEGLDREALMQALDEVADTGWIALDVDAEDAADAVAGAYARLSRPSDERDTDEGNNR